MRLCQDIDILRTILVHGLPRDDTEVPSARQDVDDVAGHNVSHQANRWLVVVGLERQDDDRGDPLSLIDFVSSLSRGRQRRRLPRIARGRSRAAILTGRRYG